MMAKKKPRPEPIRLPNGEVYTGAFVERVLTPEEAANLNAKVESIAKNPVESLLQFREDAIAKLRDYIVNDASLVPEKAREVCRPAGSLAFEPPTIMSISTAEGEQFVVLPADAPPDTRDYLELVSLFDQTLLVALEGGGFMEILSMGMAIGAVTQRLKFRPAEIELLRMAHLSKVRSANATEQNRVFTEDHAEWQRRIDELTPKISFTLACENVANEYGVKFDAVRKNCINRYPRNGSRHSKKILK